MKKYRGTMSRTEYSLCEFVVEAESEAEAEAKLYAAAGDYDWGRGNAEYDLDGFEEVEDDTIN